jgi:tRNA (adenine57-N1/adenine58-N1)-methyltransferase
LSFGYYGSVSKEGDYVQLLGSRHKSHFIHLKPGAIFQTHLGEILHDDMLDKPWGVRLYTHTGHSFYLMRPGLADIITEIKRNTQIIYPKDIGYIVVTMGIGPGTTVLEAGTGSGGLTSALAFFVGEQGKVISYDNRQEIQNLARKNLERINLLDRVTLKQGDVADGFVEREIDAIFLDLPNPYDYIGQVKTSIKLGGFVGMILPTTNQVNKSLAALKANGFAFLEICELMLRFYKPDWERLRPTDRMVAHTGYLVFARAVMDEPMQA